jgi:hypothetical protein
VHRLFVSEASGKQGDGVHAFIICSLPVRDGGIASSGLCINHAMATSATTGSN